MKDRTVKVFLALNLLCLTTVLVRSFLAVPPSAAQSASTSTSKDNPELTRLMDEDQADRTPDDAKSIDWKIVGPRRVLDVPSLAEAKAREARMSIKK